LGEWGILHGEDNIDPEGFKNIGNCKLLHPL
jgi:hypothetical protein